jgi:hypothetical protein
MLNRKARVFSYLAYSAPQYIAYVQLPGPPGGADAAAALLRRNISCACGRRRPGVRLRVFFACIMCARTYYMGNRT